MKNLIIFKPAGTITITIMVLLIIFHILVLLGVIPSNIVWCGKADDKELLMNLEIFSLVTSFIFLGIVLLKVRKEKFSKFKKVINYAIIVICVYFGLNLVGNFTAEATTEKLIFTPVTIVLTLLLFRLALEK